MKIKNYYFFIFILLFINLIFPIESTNFDLGNVNLYKFQLNPTYNVYNISSDFSVDLSFRASTDSTELDVVDSSDLDDGDTICPGTINLNLTNSGGTWAESFFVAGAVFPITWWDYGERPLACSFN